MGDGSASAVEPERIIESDLVACNREIGKCFAGTHRLGESDVAGGGHRQFRGSEIGFAHKARHRISGRAGGVVGANSEVVPLPLGTEELADTFGFGRVSVPAAVGLATSEVVVQIPHCSTAATGSVLAEELLILLGAIRPDPVAIIGIRTMGTNPGALVASSQTGDGVLQARGDIDQIAIAHRAATSCAVLGIGAGVGPAATAGLADEGVFIARVQLTVEGGIAGTRQNRQTSGVTDDGFAVDIELTTAGVERLRATAIEEHIATDQRLNTLDRDGLIGAEGEAATVGVDIAADLVNTSTVLGGIGLECQVELTATRGSNVDAIVHRDMARRLKRERCICTAGLGDAGGQRDVAVAAVVAVGTIAGIAAGGRDSHAGAVQCAANGAGLAATDGVVVGVNQPQPCFAFGCKCIHVEAVHVYRVARSLHLPAIAPQFAAAHQHAPQSRGATVNLIKVAPQHHRTAVTIDRGTGVDMCTFRHADSSSGVCWLVCCLQQRVGTSLPATADTHVTTASGTTCINAAAIQQGNLCSLQAQLATVAGAAAGIQRTGVLNRRGRQHNAPAFALLQTRGFNDATVLDNTTHQTIHRLSAEDDEATRCLHRIAIVHQGLKLAGLNTDAGESVIAVEMQVDGITRCHGHCAHLGNDGALVAHFGGKKRDIAA